MSARGRLIPVPNLDDRDWQSIRDAMVARIPELCPEWTDHNPSDPGITLIELFAVAFEELLFSLNRVLPKHLREYLNMIGVTLTPASVAKTSVIFTLSEPQSFDVVVKRGFEVSTGGTSGVAPVVFTTDEDLVIPAGDGAGSVPVSNASQIADEGLGSSDGLRDQRFYVANVPVLDMTLLVDEGDGFRVWSEVDDFSLSGPDDPHYVLNRGTGEVLFGDGRHGKVPAAGANNVKAAPYRYGGGTRGNVGAGTITQLRSSHVYIDRVTNPEAAVGGGDEETVEDAIARGPAEQLKTRNRSVTAEDFETLTLESSTGLARAKTLPLHDPAHPGEETPGVVSVIAMPRGGGTLSQALRDAIRAHLDERRLVTTRIYVIDPDYVTVHVETTVSKTPQADPGELAEKIEATLVEFLHPEYGGDSERAAAYVETVQSGTPTGERGPGWPFGRSVYLSELYELIERVRGVDHVESIASPAGPVPLEPDELPVSGAHTITVV
ncbi:MAG: putative baseplate assembly protein [Planctomycetota bacterium]|jgi:hypothetical protein